jgi:ankyrin repeat protein
MEAAANGNRDKLDKMLKSGIISDINCTDSHLRTALHHAVSEGRYKTAVYLLDNQIDPNLQSKVKRETALHIACKKAFKKIIVTLLNNNADPNIQDATGKTCLHVVAELNSREYAVAFINH